MAYWIAAQHEPQRERVAVRFLELNGYPTTYLPQIKTQSRLGRRLVRHAPLFPGYVFVSIELQGMRSDGRSGSAVW